MLVPFSMNNVFFCVCVIRLWYGLFYGKAWRLSTNWIQTFFEIYLLLVFCHYFMLITKDSDYFFLKVQGSLSTDSIDSAMSVEKPVGNEWEEVATVRKWSHTDLQLLSWSNKNGSMSADGVPCSQSDVQVWRWKRQFVSVSSIFCVCIINVFYMIKILANIYQYIRSEIEYVIVLFSV